MINWIYNIIISVEAFFEKKSSKRRPESSFVSIESFLSVIFPVPIIMYSYTLGYFHNFGVPVSPSLEQSVYFCIGTIFSSGFSYPTKVYLKYLSLQSIFILAGLGMVFFLAIFVGVIAKLKGENCNVFKRGFKFILRVFSLDFLVLIIFFITVNHFSALEMNLNGVFFLYNGNTAVNYSKAVFGVLSLLILFFPFILEICSKYMKSIFFNTPVFRVFILFLSVLFSYYLTYNYSGQYFNIPTIRLGNDKLVRVIWYESKDTVFILNCDDSLMIEGVTHEGKVFYSKDLDGIRNSNSCSTKYSSYKKN